MTKIKLFITGFISILPLLYLILILTNEIWIWLLLEHLFIAFGMFTLITLYFLIDTSRNIDIEKGSRTAWFMGIFAGNVLVIPFYWYFNILKPFRRTNKVTK
jgi:hypothetical protein